VTLPSRAELYNIAEDPSEKNDLAATNPGKVEALKARIEALAREAVPPLLVGEVFGAAKHVLFGSVVFGEEQKELDAVP
jgi:hypothetical protein